MRTSTAPDGRAAGQQSSRCMWVRGRHSGASAFILPLPHCFSATGLLGCLSSIGGVKVSPGVRFASFVDRLARGVCLGLAPQSIAGCPFFLLCRRPRTHMLPCHSFCLCPLCSFGGVCVCVGGGWELCGRWPRMRSGRDAGTSLSSLYSRRWELEDKAASASAAGQEQPYAPAPALSTVHCLASPCLALPTSGIGEPRIQAHASSPEVLQRGMRRYGANQ
ncbi:hypothetical protein B0I35DRAFT_202830 [Stachybotrys elegans]|uniref:Uncharacterized protein n=1 Tax=Stachybotrys elegans TaxID=80388 RepID=A0A8K0WTT9_9HYPO|nr:hypothetical protein B0I35DRAFT_202830 [Stachybotrys elegans]